MIITATIFQWAWWLGAVGPNEVASLLWEIPTVILTYGKVIKPLVRHIRESRQHREWQVHAEHARHHGQPPPEHPHIKL